MHTYFQETSDLDPQETREWIESLDAVVQVSGRHRAKFLLRHLREAALRQDVLPDGPLMTDYVNSIPLEDEPPYPWGQGNGAADPAYRTLECRRDGSSCECKISWSGRTSVELCVERQSL